jgi:RNA polymerase sigma factor (sigma-70 family)
VVPDEDLVGLVCAGGTQREEAWRELVRRHTPRMVAVARSFGLDGPACDDLVQTAWLRFLERAGQLRDAGALGPWLCTVVRNEARRLVTRRRTVPVGDGWDAMVSATDPPDHKVLRTEREHALRVAFARLGEECRRLLALLVSEPPLSYDEIAAAVGRPRGSLGPTRRRCLEQLRRHLPGGTEGG